MLNLEANWSLVTFIHETLPAPFMELFGEWFLHHRTEEELLQLALEAGVLHPENILVEKEPEKINLFMRIQHKT